MHDHPQSESSPRQESSLPLPFDDDYDTLGAARGVTLCLPLGLAYWCLAAALVMAAL